MSNGFERSVARKMPRVRSEVEESAEPIRGKSSDVHDQIIHEEVPLEKEVQWDALSLVADLESQLQAAQDLKAALERDLTSAKKTIDQLFSDNKELRALVEDQESIAPRLQKLEQEITYLEEENSDALIRIQVMRTESEELKENIAKLATERDTALGENRMVKSRMKEEETLRIQIAYLEKERKRSLQRQSELEENLKVALQKNTDLEKECHNLKKAMNEIKQSLLLVRNHAKRGYYDSMKEEK